MELGIAVVFATISIFRGLLTPFDGNSYKRLVSGATEASEPLKKQLWNRSSTEDQQSACVLEQCNKDGDALLFKYKKVKSGDSSNEEAASIYWKRLLGEDFS